MQDELRVKLDDERAPETFLPALSLISRSVRIHFPLGLSGLNGKPHSQPQQRHWPDRC